MYISTFAALKALPKSTLADGQIVELVNYAQPGDGGGGRFHWDADSTDTPVASIVVAADEGGVGRWYRHWRHTAVSPRWFGAVGDRTTNDQSAIAAMLPTMDGNGVTARSQSYWPYGAYGVDQLRFDLQGATHDFAGALICGISTADKASVVDVRGGSSHYNGLRVQAGGRLNYESAIHWYTNNVGLHYPGYLTMNQVEVHEARIGMMIGALPTQSVIGGRGDALDDDKAIDAPLSESTIFGLITRNCMRGLYMRQPNGKVTLVGSVVRSELEYDNSGLITGTWANYATPQDSVALSIANDGSELAMLGGMLGNMGKHGYLLQVTGGRLDLIGVTVETARESYADGHSYLSFRQLQDFGFNYVDAPCFTLGPDFDGSFHISDSRILRPTNFASGGQHEVVKSVAGLGLGYRPNPAVVLEFSSVEFRDCPWRSGGNYYMPLVRGVRARFHECLLTSYVDDDPLDDESPLRRASSVRISDGPNRLTDGVDTSFASLPAYPQSGSASSIAGWSFAVTGTGNAWGRSTTALPDIEGVEVPAWLRLTGGTAGSVSAVSSQCDGKPAEAHIVRGFIETGASTAPIKIAVRHYDAAGALLLDQPLFDGPENVFGTVCQPLLFHFVPPPGGEKFALALEAGIGADLRIALPEIG